MVCSFPFWYVSFKLQPIIIFKQKLEKTYSVRDSSWACHYGLFLYFLVSVNNEEFRYM